jgi:hypothetical protein
LSQLIPDIDSKSLIAMCLHSHYTKNGVLLTIKCASPP